ncbi:hypothetical protein DW047_12460 [Phocaeicola vulgatus]|nr:hypothetical protein DW047_12460 [Phocaeicola vulgatus]
MKRGCVKTTHPPFCFIKNVFLNKYSRHYPPFCFIKNVFLNKYSRHYSINNLNSRFTLLTFVISAITSILPYL